MLLLSLLFRFFVYGDESCGGDVIDRVQRIRNLEDELLAKGVLE